MNIRSSKGLLLTSSGIAILFLISAAPAFADPVSPGVNVHVGTEGYGVGADVGVTDHLAVRGEFNTFQFNKGVNSGDIAYHGNINFLTGGAYLDYRPWSSGWLILSGGVLGGDRSLNATATPSSNVTIGNSTYTPAQVGTLKGKIKMSAVVPYVGVGGEWHVFGGFHARADLGVDIGGKPTVSLTDSGGGVSATDLHMEASKAQHDANFASLWPVAKVTFVYRFH